jgi:hypothetical protein
LLYGPTVWLSWLAAVPGFAHQIEVEGGGIKRLMPTIVIAVQQLGAPLPLAYMVQWLGVTVTAATVGYLFSRGADRLAGAGLMAAVFLVTPYAFIFDMPVVATAVIWFATERYRDGEALDLGEILAIVLALAAPVILNAGGSNFAVGPLSLALLLGLIARRCRRLRAAAALEPVPYHAAGSL